MRLGEEMSYSDIPLKSRTRTLCSFLVAATLRSALRGQYGMGRRARQLTAVRLSSSGVRNAEAQLGAGSSRRWLRGWAAGHEPADNATRRIAAAVALNKNGPTADALLRARIFGVTGMVVTPTLTWLGLRNARASAPVPTIHIDTNVGSFFGLCHRSQEPSSVKIPPSETRNAL